MKHNFHDALINLHFYKDFPTRSEGMTPRFGSF